MTRAIALHSGTVRRTDVVQGVITHVRNVWNYIAAYRQYRRECAELVQLDGAMLKDIGLSRADAIRIAGTPFSEYRAARR